MLPMTDDEKSPEEQTVGTGSSYADTAIGALIEIAKGQEYAAADRIAAAGLLLTLTV